MKNKTIIFSLLALTVLVSVLQSVSAYHNGYAHNPHGTRYVFGFDGEAFAQDYRYVDYYGRPAYRVYRFNDDDNDGELTRRDKKRAVRFLERSFNERYAITTGKSSGDAFCQGCKVQSYSPTNFGNKPAFDLVSYGNDGNYYKPVYDYKLDRFNWRF